MAFCCGTRCWPRPQRASSTPWSASTTTRAAWHCGAPASCCACASRATAWQQTVKRQDESDGGLTRRPEWQAPYLNHFDFSHVDDAELRAWLQQDKIAARLTAVFETNIRRTVWQLDRGPGSRILVKLDRGWIASNGRRETISELELQLMAGSIDSLYALALELARRQALPPLLLSKADRGYRLFLNTPPAPVKAGEVPIDAADTPLAAFAPDRTGLPVASAAQPRRRGAQR